MEMFVYKNLTVNSSRLYGEMLGNFALLERTVFQLFLEIYTIVFNVTVVKRFGTISRWWKRDGLMNVKQCHGGKNSVVVELRW